MAEIARWQTLVCPCGSRRFYTVYEMRRHASGGLSQDPVGHRCASCHNDADVQAMQRDLLMTRRRAELAALEAEIDEAQLRDPPPVPTSAF